MSMRCALWPLAAIVLLGASPAPPSADAAACREGKVVWYTSAETELVQALAKSFEARHPCIAVQVQRAGAERNFQRLSQEYAAGIHATDVVDSSDATHFLYWKQQGWLASYVPHDLAGDFPAGDGDPEGTYAVWRATLSVMGYNTKLVDARQAPASYADLLAPRWSGKIVKAHPGYSGTILTATYAIARDVGWPFLEGLAKQGVLQTQSANDPPRTLASGEREVMADGVEYLLLEEKKAGAPVAPIYPREGTPLVLGALGMMKDAPHPNAARLFEDYLFSVPAQQLLVDVGQMRSLDRRVHEPAGRRALRTIKLLRDDLNATAAHADEVKQRYTALFGV
jgi:iron(III) transport system substrate-binding protein